jgi:transposase-like protein
MKEAYAVRRTVPPSAEIEARIEQMLSFGVGDNPRETLSELARLGARLIIQRAVEDEFDAWLGRARYERRPRAQPVEGGEEGGLRNGFRPRTVQTAEGELGIEIPQVRRRDLISRGLGAPMLIVADGAPGLTKAIEQCWPASDRQRCCVHRARNLYAKLPERERERVKHAYWQALDEAISEQDGKQRLQALVEQLNIDGFTAAARCLSDDLDALVVHLRYPLRHRRRRRSTNLLERSLGEVKRRTKVMGRFPGETSCLTLVWAVLDLLNHSPDQRHPLHRARPPAPETSEIHRQ